MIKLDDMVFAIDETQKKFPGNTFEGVYAQIIAKVPESLLKITSRENARKTIAASSPTELVQAIALEIVRIYNYGELIKKTDPEYANQKTFIDQYNVLIRKCPGYELVNGLIRVFRNPKVNAVAYLLEDNKALLDALHIVDRYYYSYDKQFREVLAKYGSGAKVPQSNGAEISEKIKQDGERVRGVSNVHVNMRGINKCYEDVIRGLQVRNRSNEYALGGSLFATMDVGKKRHNQEDSVLIMEHPKNPNFKILVVSDGMGGGIAGEDVSSYTVRTIARWFESVNPAMYENPQQLQYLFNTQINEISNVIFKKYNSADQTRAGATFTGAIITKDQTVITQIGDSRAYIVNNGNLLRRENINLITRDESFVWPVDKDFHPKDPKDISPAEIEDSKYYNRSNVILRCIGDENVGANDQSFMIPNTSYDKLLLMSDGASDLLSFEGIKIICRNTPWEYITKYLVEAALKKNAIRGKEWDAFYTKLVDGTLTEEELARYNALQGIADAEHKGSIAAGKDNTTVAGYFRR